MPRTKRSQGRPGTRVIPKDWETSHAPVVNKTHTAHCLIFAPAGTTALYDGACRVQVQKAQDNATAVGEQDQRTAGYLVVINRDGADIPDGAIVQFTACTDPSLLGNRRLFVRQVDRGSLRFERDLFCVDDLTRTFIPS